MKKYEEQLNRVKRYFYRFEEINNGKKHSSNSDRYIDDIYSFFMHCHHLKDWLKEDPAFTHYKSQEIEDYVNKNKDSLVLCEDISNGLKHLERNRPPRSGSQPEFKERRFSILLKESHEPFIKIQVNIEHDGKKIDAFEIAKKSLDAWEDFL